MRKGTSLGSSYMNHIERSTGLIKPHDGDDLADVEETFPANLYHVAVFHYFCQPQGDFTYLEQQ